MAFWLGRFQIKHLQLIAFCWPAVAYNFTPSIRHRKEWEIAWAKLVPIEAKVTISLKYLGFGKVVFVFK